MLAKEAREYTNAYNNPTMDDDKTKMIINKLLNDMYKHIEYRARHGYTSTKEIIFMGLFGNIKMVTSNIYDYGDSTSEIWWARTLYNKSQNRFEALVKNYLKPELITQGYKVSAYKEEVVKDTYVYTISIEW